MIKIFCDYCKKEITDGDFAEDYVIDISSGAGGYDEKISLGHLHYDCADAIHNSIMVAIAKIAPVKKEEVVETKYDDDDVITSEDDYPYDAWLMDKDRYPHPKKVNDLGWDKTVPCKKEFGNRYRTLMKLAFQYDRLRYMDIVELYLTGEVRKWNKNQRMNNRGYGACNLQGHNRTGSPLAKYFSKGTDGWYYPRFDREEALYDGGRIFYPKW